MFAWLKPDPEKRLRRRYEAKMKEARDAEKFGDRARQADLYAEAEALYEELTALSAEASS